MKADLHCHTKLSDGTMKLPVGGGGFVRAGWRKTPSGELVKELLLPPGWREI